MSTHSLIGYVTPLGLVRCVYCHLDGYVQKPGVGFTLFHHYQDPQKVAALVELGELHTLGERLAPNPGEVHVYGNRLRDVVIACHRDEGGELKILEVSRADYLHNQPDHGQRYVYLFNKGSWWWRENSGRGWRKLAAQFRTKTSRT